MHCFTHCIILCGIAFMPETLWPFLYFVYFLVKLLYPLNHRYPQCLTSQQLDVRVQSSAFSVRTEGQVRACRWPLLQVSHKNDTVTTSAVSHHTQHKHFLLPVSASGLNSRNVMPESQPGALWGLFINPTMHYKL